MTIHGNWRFSENHTVLVGWFVDSERPTTSLNIEIWIDDVPVRAVRADFHRPDLGGRYDFLDIGFMADMAEAPGFAPGAEVSVVDAVSGLALPPGPQIVPGPLTEARLPVLSLPDQDGGLVLRTTRRGTFLLNERDIGVDAEMLAFGEYAESELEVLWACADPERPVYDVGANIGALAIPLAAWVAPGTSVVAIEPQVPVFHRLCANLALNGVANVRALNIGAGAQSDRMFMDHQDLRQLHSSGGMRLNATGRGHPVDIQPLDEVVGPDGDAGLIKIDVEGFEADVLAGAREVILRRRPTIYVECVDAKNFAFIFDLLDGEGYRLFWHPAPMFRTDNFFNNPDDHYHGGGLSPNVLALSDKDPPVDLIPCRPGEFWPAARFPGRLQDRIASWSARP